MGMPSMRMLPSSGWSRPLKRESRVDLPHPDGPTTARNSPGFIKKETSESAGVSPSMVW